MPLLLSLVSNLIMHLFGGRRYHLPQSENHISSHSLAQTNSVSPISDSSLPFTRDNIARLESQYAFLSTYLSSKQPPSASEIDATDCKPQIHATSVHEESFQAISITRDDRTLHEDPHILETHPDYTQTVWQQVSEQMTTNSCLLRSKLPGANQTSFPQLSKTGSLTSTKAGNSATPEKKIKAPSPYDKDFPQRVLYSRKINFDKAHIPLRASGHFELHSEPNGECNFYYTEQRSAPVSPVWLNADEQWVEEVTEDYDSMMRERLCEAEFAAYALEKFLRRDRRLGALSRKKEERLWHTIRVLELVAKPTETLWMAPPVLEQDEKEGYTNYDFDIRPDCAYWLSDQAFARNYKPLVNQHVFVSGQQAKVTCPYLTIEFKKDECDISVARNQVAAATALFLYNRYELRRRSLELSGQEWSVELSKHLQQYGMTFTGSTYEVWWIEPLLTDEFKWDGCCMHRVWSGECTDADSVCDLIDWINEIHCWGLTVHGPQCELDVKACLAATQGRSRIGVSGNRFPPALGGEGQRLAKD